MFVHFFIGVSLCEEYNIDAETLVEQWMAFSLTNLGGAPPSLENLDLLVRKEFSKRTVNRPNVSVKENTRSTAGASLTVYGTSVSAQYPFNTSSTCFFYYYV